MKNNTHVFNVLFAILITILGNVNAECLGKFELAPAYVHIDVLEAKKTVKKLDMAAIRLEGSWLLGKGWCLKPYGLYGRGKGELGTVSLGLGRCIPVTDYLVLTPQAGISYTYLSTQFRLDLGPMGKRSFDENFQSYAPYVGLEATLKLAPNFRVGANIQYAWCRSRTEIKHLINSKETSRGPNIGFVAEYDLNQQWSVNFGFAYNESLSREKNGLRGYGAKLGIAKWF